MFLRSITHVLLPRFWFFIMTDVHPTVYSILLIHSNLGCIYFMAVNDTVVKLVDSVVLISLTFQGGGNYWVICQLFIEFSGNHQTLFSSDFHFTFLQVALKFLQVDLPCIFLRGYFHFKYLATFLDYFKRLKRIGISPLNISLDGIP